MVQHMQARPRISDCDNLLLAVAKFRQICIYILFMFHKYMMQARPRIIERLGKHVANASIAGVPL